MRTSPLLAPPWSLCPYNERSPLESTAKRLPPRWRPASRGHLLRAALEREEAPLGGEPAGVGSRAVVDRDHASRTDRDPERTERRIHDVVADGDEPFASRSSEQPFARVVHQGCQGRHRIASFSFFIASATRERAASSL